METRGLKVNINKMKLMLMGREPAVRPQRGRYPHRVCGKVVGANSIWCQQCRPRTCTVNLRLLFVVQWIGLPYPLIIVVFVDNKNIVQLVVIFNDLDRKVL